MKRTIVLRIESESIEEYEIQVPEWEGDILHQIFNEQIWQLPKKEVNEVLLKIAMNSSDERLVFYTLPILETNVKSAELYEVYKKHIRSEDVQLAIVWYATKKKKKQVLRRIQKETAFEMVRFEAKEALNALEKN